MQEACRTPCIADAPPVCAGGGQPTRTSGTSCTRGCDTLNRAVVTEPPDVPHRVCPGGGHDTCGTFNGVNTTVRKRPENWGGGQHRHRVLTSTALVNRARVVQVPPDGLSPPAPPPGEAHACCWRKLTPAETNETNATVRNRPEGRDVRLRLTASVAPASFHIASPFVAFPCTLFGTFVCMQACVACSYHERGGARFWHVTHQCMLWWIPRVVSLPCYTCIRKLNSFTSPRFPRPRCSHRLRRSLTPSSYSFATSTFHTHTHTHTHTPPRPSPASPLPAELAQTTGMTRP